MDTATGTATARAFSALLLTVLGFSTSTPGFAQSPSLTPNPTSQELTFLPGVRTTLRQAWRSPDDPALSGTQLEVTPYFNATANTSRLQANVSYAMRNFYRFGGEGESTALRHSLNGTFNAALYDDFFWLAGAAQVGTLNASPLAITTPDPGSSFSNTVNFRTFNLRPYVRGQFSNFAQYRGEYSYTNSNITTTLVARDDHRLTGTLNSGSLFGPNWGWSATGTTQRRVFEGGTQLDRNTSSFTGYYFPNPELRLGASINYDQVDGLVARDGTTRGVGPGASVDWAPNSRVKMSANVSNQYYGNNAAVNATYRLTNTTFGFSYNRGIITSFSGSIFNVDPASIFGGTGAVGVTNSVVQQLLLNNLLSGFGIPAGAGVTNDAVVLDKSMTFTIGHVLPRGGLSFTAFRSDRTSEFNVSAASSFGARSGGSQVSVFTTTQLNRDGFRLTGNYRLGATATLNTAFRYDRFLSSVSNIESVTNGVDLGLTLRLTQDLSANTGIRFTRFNAERPTVSTTDETILFGTLDMRF